MAEEKVEVTIHPDGKVEMHVVGVQGMACLVSTEELTRILGGEVISQEMTSEAYLDTEEEQVTRQWH